MDVYCGLVAALSRIEVVVDDGKRQRYFFEASLMLRFEILKYLFPPVLCPFCVGTGMLNAPNQMSAEKIKIQTQDLFII